MEDKVYQIRELNKAFFSAKGERTVVFENLSMDLPRGKITAVLGPSGCGKSTLLNILAGFESCDSGTVPEQSGVGVVFQTPALFPWLTVEENVRYGLKRRKVPKDQQEALITKYLKLVQLENCRTHYPRELSGGMQQRAALARTLILQPELLLMDEPFSALDIKLRMQMQQLTLDLWEKLDQTILIVTHDIEEALILADTIYLMEECPGGIKEVIQVPWQKKEEGIRSSEAFFELKNKLLNQY